MHVIIGFFRNFLAGFERGSLHFMCFRERCIQHLQATMAQFIRAVAGSAGGFVK